MPSILVPVEALPLVLVPDLVVVLVLARDRTEVSPRVVVPERIVVRLPSWTRARWPRRISTSVSTAVATVRPAVLPCMPMSVGSAMHRLGYIDSLGRQPNGGRRRVCHGVGLMRAESADREAGDRGKDECAHFVPPEVRSSRTATRFTAFMFLLRRDIDAGTEVIEPHQWMNDCSCRCAKPAGSAAKCQNSDLDRAVRCIRVHGLQPHHSIPRNCLTAATVRAGSSSSGAWPRSSKIASVLPRISRWKRSASSGGSSRSRPPQRISVGRFSSGMRSAGMLVRRCAARASRARRLPARCVSSTYRLIFSCVTLLGSP